MKQQVGLRLTPAAIKWIEEESKRQGISKNNVIQLLINKEMEKKEAG